MNAAPGVKPAGTIDLEIKVIDGDVIKYLMEFDEEERAEKALEALKVGVIAIRSASPSLDTVVVEEKFREVEGNIDERVKAFEEELKTGMDRYFRADGGEVAQLLDTKMGPGSDLARQMDPDNTRGLSQTIRKMVEEILQQNSSQIIGAFSLDDESSALSRMRKSIQEQIGEIEKKNKEHFSQITAALGKEEGKAEEAVKGTAKGREFEDGLYERLAGIARGLEDEVENVSDISGVDGKKVGDYVVTLGETSYAPGEKIVIEAKKAGNYTSRKALDELAQAKKNRGAEIGIFAFCAGYEPEGIRDFVRSGQDFIVTVDEESLEERGGLIFLEAAYKIARTLIVTRKREEEKEGVDVEFIKRELENLQKDLEDASDASRRAKLIRDHAEKIEEKLGSMEEAFRERLGRIQDRLPG